MTKLNATNISALMMGTTSISQEEAFRAFVAGELVTVQDMVGRMQADGRFCLDAEELSEPCSEPRKEGLPVVEVAGVVGTFFHPAGVFVFLEGWLETPQQEVTEMEVQAQTKKDREAQWLFNLEHPTPERTADVMNHVGSRLLATLQENLRHQNVTVRAGAREVALQLMAGLDDLKGELAAVGPDPTGHFNSICKN
jgi:hypothetical protein